jgi:hypothetical protein
MDPSFKIVALPSERFAPLFSQTDGELQTLGARRMVVDKTPGYPCRVSLTDAQVGETVLLVPFIHHDVSSPYRASGPIFVRRAATTAQLEANEIPAAFRHRLLSLRGYDAADMMVGAEVVPGTSLEDGIRGLFANDKVRYLHIHNARPGCYSCRVERVAAES